MSKYQVEALRTIRSLQEAHTRAGHTAQAEQMRKIGDQVEAMADQLHTMTTALRANDADYVALREAVRPVAEWLKYAEIAELSAPYVEEDGEKRLEVFATTEELDALAALVGEE